ncbi:hypothetical protein MTO96_005122 [Rhipicephalus appendiculatus]
MPKCSPRKWLQCARCYPHSKSNFFYVVARLHFDVKGLNSDKAGKRQRAKKLKPASRTSGRYDAWASFARLLVGTPKTFFHVTPPA